MSLGKVSELLAGCSVGCVLLFATSAQAQTNMVHQLGVLSAGDHQFETGSYFDSYEIEGSAGQRVSISLDSSDFNTFLGLFDSEGTLIVTNDDAAEENPNSYISTTLPQSGTYTVVATSHAPEGSGDYRLTMRSFAPPTPTRTTTSTASSGSGWNGLSAFLSMPIVQEVLVDTFFSSMFSSGGSSSSYDSYPYPTTTRPSRPSGGMARPAGSGIHGGGPQHGTRNAW
ncbi:MAG: PPC domain-containing protein [Cyanobacteria bacterium J06606_4]